jgi:predicted DNA-binding transcriptional regulator YafY
MAYDKAADLLDLAMQIAARRFGMAYSEIDRISQAPAAESRRRNTQRMVGALERVFGTRLSTKSNEQGEKCVLLEGDGLRELVDLRPDEMTALDHAIEALSASNALLDAESLKALRTKIRLAAPAKKMRRLEVDYEAILAASHVVARPGPVPRIDPENMRPLAEALLAMKQVSFDYRHNGAASRRTVHPYGIVSGYRAYLVALTAGAAGTRPSTWRIDRMSEVTVLDAPSAVPPDFDIAAHAKRAFGVFQSDAEYGEVEWRFSPKVADSVRSFRFHPDQELSEEPDGSITLKFSASGHLEMAWALYPWGRHVEVVKPEPLRRMVEGYQRDDFPSVP